MKLRALAATAAMLITLAFGAAPARAATPAPSVTYCHLVVTHGHAHYIDLITSQYDMAFGLAPRTRYDIIPPFRYGPFNVSGQWWDIHVNPVTHGLQPGPAVYFWLNGCR